MSYLEALVSRRKLLKPKITAWQDNELKCKRNKKRQKNFLWTLLPVHEVLTALNSESFEFPLSTEALGDEPSSEPSRTGDGGRGGAT